MSLFPSSFVNTASSTSGIPSGLSESPSGAMAVIVNATSRLQRLTSPVLLPNNLCLAANLIHPQIISGGSIDRAPCERRRCFVRTASGAHSNVPINVHVDRKRRTDCRHPLSCVVNEFMPCSPKWNLCLSSFGRFLSPQIRIVRHDRHSRYSRNHSV